MIAALRNSLPQHSVRGFAEHRSAATGILRFGHEWFDPLFSFAVVRNPFDRLWSLYNYFMQSRPNAQFNPEDYPFERWVRALLVDQALEVVGGQPIWSRPQTAWVSSDGEVVVDYIGKFERLPETWREIATQIGIPDPDPLPHMNSSRHSPYRDIYREHPTLIELVGRFYHNDLIEFGYDF